IAARVKEFEFNWEYPLDFDTAAFIRKLDPLTLSSVHIEVDTWDSTSFAGLSRSFWEKFFNERLSSGAIEYVEVEYVDEADDDNEFMIEELIKRT
ncbi:hypothetical protein PMAYCL1PPCAC_26490, partial [Pristionchus mayeri]